MHAFTILPRSIALLITRSNRRHYFANYKCLLSVNVVILIAMVHVAPWLIVADNAVHSAA